MISRNLIRKHLLNGSLSIQVKSKGGEGEECSIDARSPLIGQRRDVSARGFSKPIKK